MKKLFITLAMALVSVVSFAYDVEVNGIYYNLNMKAKTAEVTNRTGKISAQSYSGDVVIPDRLNVNEDSYLVTSIGSYAFAHCYNLTSVTISDSIENIGSYVFENCLSLTSITIPNSVTSIGDEVFVGCTKLPIIDNFRYADTYWVGAVNNKLHTYNIKDGTRFIGCHAFIYCTDFTSIEIGNSVTNIGFGAFANCSSLTSATIGNFVPGIGVHTFFGCSNLLDVYCYAKNVPLTTYSIFDDSTYSIATLHVPAVALENYKATEPWSGFSSIVPLTEQEMYVKIPYADVTASSAIFDVQGHLLTQPSRGGVNIINGKKIIMTP